MSRPKRQKIDRESLAAFAASQPLFDSLRHATSKVAEQGAHLATARHVVQTTHVKIENSDNHFSTQRHKRYMDAAVKAWHSATEAYCSIFEQLVSITAADPTEGREKGERYEEFVSLLDTARKAEETAKKFDTAKDEEEEDDEAEESAEPATHTNGTGKRPMAASESESTSEAPQKKSQSESANSTKPTPTPTSKPSALSEDIRYDQSGTKILWQDGILKVSYQSLTPEEKRAWDVIKNRLKHQKKRSRIRERTKQKQQGQNTTSAVEMPNHQVPGVEYEDVSAEVEARLKAKAEKKAAEKAKKAEKKRKRESGDSYTAAVDSAFTNAGGEAGEDAPNAVEAAKEKPAKKRARQSENGDEGAKSAADGAAPPAEGVKSKRKKSLYGEVEIKSGESVGKSAKKRKKSNS